MSERKIGGMTRREWENKLRDITINTGRIELLNAAFAEPDGDVERLRSALKVIHTWASFVDENGDRPALDGDDVTHLCRDAMPDAETVPADLNRQRCVNLEWRVKEIEQRVSDTARIVVRIRENTIRESEVVSNDISALEQRVRKLEAMIGGKSPFPKCPSCGRSVVAKVNTRQEVRTYKCENKSCITDTIRIERN